jgi:hypothetical protein
MEATTKQQQTKSLAAQVAGFPFMVIGSIFLGDWRMTCGKILLIGIDSKPVP